MWPNLHHKQESKSRFVRGAAPVWWCHSCTLTPPTTRMLHDGACAVHLAAIVGVECGVELKPCRASSHPAVYTLSFFNLRSQVREVLLTWHFDPNLTSKNKISHSGILLPVHSTFSALKTHFTHWKFWWYFCHQSAKWRQSGRLLSFQHHRSSDCTRVKSLCKWDTRMLSW